MMCCFESYIVFFCNDTATTEIYTYLHALSLHDALPISCASSHSMASRGGSFAALPSAAWISASRRLPYSKRNMLACSTCTIGAFGDSRSEEHTSELQSLMRISYAVFCL